MSREWLNWLCIQQRKICLCQTYLARTDLWCKHLTRASKSWFTSKSIALSKKRQVMLNCGLRMSLPILSRNLMLRRVSSRDSSHGHSTQQKLRLSRSPESMDQNLVKSYQPLSQARSNLACLTCRRITVKSSSTSLKATLNRSSILQGWNRTQVQLKNNQVIHWKCSEVLQSWASKRNVPSWAMSQSKSSLMARNTSSIWWS